MPTYYVSATGSDSNDGSSANPWKSLNKAVATAPAGTSGNRTVILVRAGTYNCETTGILNHKLVINKPWFTIQAETPGNRPIFRHTMQMGSSLPDVNHGVLIFVPNGTNGITLDGLQIERFSGASAIRVGSDGGNTPMPSDITIRNCVTYWTRGQGINIYGSNSTKEENFSRRVIVENNRVICASMLSLMGTVSEAPDNASGAIRVGNTWSATIRNNRIEYSFGEGFDLGKRLYGTAADPVLIYGNVVMNCHHVHFYLLHVKHAYCFNNIVYATQGNGAVELQSPYDPGNTYKINDERPDLYACSEDVFLYNNVGVNGDAVFQISAGWRERNGIPYPQDVKRVWAGFNTWVGGYFTSKSMVDTGPNLKDSLFENNIIDDVNARKGSGYGIAKDPFNTVRQNAWTALPSAPWRHGESVVHADLGMVAPHVDLRTTGWGMNYGTLAEFDAAVSDNFDVTRYHLTAGARARDEAGPRQNTAAITVPITPFQVDYRGATRAAPDMGFHEASGQVVVHVEADYAATPGGTALDTGTAVTFTNQSVVTGTTVSGYVWTVKKGAATQQTATTPNFNYTFPTAGSYTVALEVQTPAGNDTHTVAYTISDPTQTPTVDAVIGRSPSGLSHQAGTTVTFTDNSTFTLCTFVSRLWEVKTSGGTLVASGATSPWSHQFNTAGTFTVKLTETASGGLSDTQTLTYTITAAPSEVTANFTSSDADLIIEEGDSVTFANTSTAAGTTISGYVWTVGPVGGATNTFTTTNLTYTFPTAGVWTVTLQATGADGTVDTRSVAVIVQSSGGPVGGSTFAVVAKPFALATSVGTQTITAAALGDMVPRGVHLKVVGATAAGTAANGALWSEGAAMVGAQWAQARFSANGQAVSQAKRMWSGGDIFLTLDGTGAVTGRGAFARFVPGGMEINISDAPPAAYLAEATFYAGDDCLFAAGSVAPGTRDVPTPVTTGFRPDAVYFMSTWAQDEGAATADADMSRGWAVRSGEEGVNQAHFRNEDRDGVDTTFVITRFNNTLAASSADAATGFMSLTVLSLDATGFTMRPNSSTMSRLMGWFAFNGGTQVQLVATETLAAPAPSPLVIPFEAQTVMALTSSMRSPNTQLGGVDAVGQGWYVKSVHDSVDYSLSIAAAAGAATTATRSLAATGFRAVNHDGGDLWAGTAALDADSLDLTLTTAPAAACYVIVLAIEAGEEIDDPVEGPIADFTAEFESDAPARRLTAWFDSRLSNGNGETITGYLWDFGDGTTSTEANPVHVYDGVGEYDVSLTVTTAAGSDTETKAGFVVVEGPGSSLEIVWPNYPLTSGGPTQNALDENYDHSHLIAGPWVNVAAMTTQEAVDVFLAMPPDEVYALWAWDEVNNRLLVKRTDGTMRAVATTAL